MRRDRRRGLTLLELLMTISVLAIVVALAVPSSSSADDRVRLLAAAWILTSDIEFAQVMSISDPGNPLIVRFSEDRAAYWVARASTPNTPIARPDTGESYEVVLGQGRAATAEGVVFVIASMANATLQFEPHGGLSDFTQTPTITLKMVGKADPSHTLSIAPTTGSISEVGNL